MGLDAVEIVMEVEEAFGIKIPDERASQIITVGDLHDCIVEQRPNALAPARACLSAATFYRIRRAVCAEFRLDPKTVWPRTALYSTLPKIHRRMYWSRLQRELGLKLPSLVRPSWLVLLAVIVVEFIALSVFFSNRDGGLKGASYAAIGAMLIGGVIAAIITVPFKTQFAPAFANYRGLSNVVLAHNYATLSQPSDAGTQTDIWEALKVIIVEQLGVKPELVKRDARFVDDLGLS